MTKEERELYKQLGNRVAFIRENIKDWTQEQLADRAGIGRSSIANLERGEQAVPLHKIVKIAKALNIPTLALLKNIV